MGERGVVSDTPNSSDEIAHPTLDGRPILLGDWLHATDPETNDRMGNTFTMKGQVRHVYSDHGGAVVVLAPEDGMTEEFYVDSTVLRRIAPVPSGSQEVPRG